MSQAVLLVSHGTVDELDDLPAFVTNVRRGHAPSPELVAELRRRYEAIGGSSPLNTINAELARKLSSLLGTRVAWANRLWRPYVRDVLEELVRDGARRVVVVALAQHSGHVYAEDARKAATEVEVTLACAPSWGDSLLLHAAFAKRIRAALDEDEDTVRVVMTAHSLPKAVVDRGDPYALDVRSAAEAIAKQAGLHRWSLAFQSQGMSGPPGDWLGPDLTTTLDLAREEGDARVVFAPIGFLADHVEVLYDLDIEAASMARERGLRSSRTASLNADDDLVEAIADVVRRTTGHA